jgi:predicted PurR-regulated permease PerM
MNIPVKTEDPRGAVEAPESEPAGESPPNEGEAPLPPAARPPKSASTLWILAVLATIAFLYFARPVVLPLLLAWMAATTLRPLVRLLGRLHLPIPVAAGIVFFLLIVAIGVGFAQVGRPAARWINDAPKHMTELRQRFQMLFPKAMNVTQATEAMSNLGATPEEKKQAQKDAPVVKVEDQRGASSVLDWTGTLLAGLGEVLVLIYLLLAAGDLFLQKLVRVMPTLQEKKRAIEITHEIQQSISNYMFSVLVINTCVGVLASIGFYFMKVPNPELWGVLVAVLNFVPYFGPIVGVLLLAAIGVLTSPSPTLGLVPPLWYLLIHLIESNFVTPILLGKRLTLNPVAIFVSLMFWIWLWGVPGALLSVPILVSIKVVCDRVPQVSYLGELIGD